ncbi:hypothetical protein ACOMHN_032579 [Nucella lapillus]
MFRKLSSSDLHSRLKTRKVLGVGETDDGDIHRSKLSQILGHSDQLYVKLPWGLRVWQLVLAVSFTVTSLWALVFPSHLLDVTLAANEVEHVTVSVRLYGTALLALALFHWNTFHSIDRDAIRVALLSSLLFFSLQTVVSTLSAVPLRALWPLSGVLVHVCRLGAISLSAYMYWLLYRDARHYSFR